MVTRALVALVLCAGAAHGAEQTYTLLQGKDGPGIRTTLAYTTGTHDNHVVRALGEVRFDPDAPQALSGAFRVPIDALVSDSAERDCHMREALGLDYTKSRFPNDHVCKDDKLPAADIAYPEIRLDLKGAIAPTVASLAANLETPVTIEGAWTIHGVTKPVRLHLTASRDAKLPGAIRLRGNTAVRLKDFGVVVKSAGVLFVTISVADAATVYFDLTLVPAATR